MQGKTGMVGFRLVGLGMAFHAVGHGKPRPLAASMGRRLPSRMSFANARPGAPDRVLLSRHWSARRKAVVDLELATCRGMPSDSWRSLPDISRISGEE